MWSLIDGQIFSSPDDIFKTSLLCEVSEFFYLHAEGAIEVQTGGSQPARSESESCSSPNSTDCKIRPSHLKA